jgi:hypothetical protein
MGQWLCDLLFSPGAAPCPRRDGVGVVNLELPSSPKARFAFSIDKKESKGPLRKVSAPLSSYKAE